MKTKFTVTYEHATTLSVEHYIEWALEIEADYIEGSPQTYWQPADPPELDVHTITLLPGDGRRLTMDRWTAHWDDWVYTYEDVLMEAAWQRIDDEYERHYDRQEADWRERGDLDEERMFDDRGRARSINDA